MPFITQTAIGMRDELSVFGNDYPTRDGTCIRDYIHVMDLAQAHVEALERLLGDKTETNFEVFNLGTGNGNTVLDVINTFQKVTKVNLPYKITGRREGDVVAAFADTEKANKILGWKAKRDLSEGLKSAWKWQQKLSMGKN